MGSKLKRVDMFNPEEEPYSILFSLARYRFAGRLLNKIDSVLDVGCGVGTGTRYLKDFCSGVTGIDIDPDAVAKANQMYYTPMEHLHFYVMDAQHIDKRKLPLFNAIVSIDNIEHLMYPEDFVSDVYDMLPMGGMFVCGTPRKQDTPSRNKWHYEEFEPAVFYDLLESYFPRVFKFGMNEEVVSVFNVNTCWYLWGVALKL